MNLDQIWRTATAFLNEYDLPDTYSTAFPNENYPVLSFVYANRRGDDLTNELMWKPTEDGGEVAHIEFNGIAVTVSTYWDSEDAAEFRAEQARDDALMGDDW